MAPRWTLHGRRVFITGGARGIGFETARALADRGARVALIDLEPAVLDAASAQIPGAIRFVADVTDNAALAAAVQGTVAAFGGIDVVLANAGIAPVGFMRLTDVDAFERGIEVNLLGVWRTIHATLPHVIEARGYVLPIASVAAVTHTPAMGSYCISKAGVEALANVLRIEVAHLGVDVGCGYFSFLDTPMVRGGQEKRLWDDLMNSLPNPVSKVYPVRLGVRAIVRGIERRARLVYAPSFIARPMIAMRTVLQPATELAIKRRMAELDAKFAAEVAERGAAAASEPAGPGGAAAMRQ